MLTQYKHVPYMLRDKRVCWKHHGYFCKFASNNELQKSVLNHEYEVKCLCLFLHYFVCMQSSNCRISHNTCSTYVLFGKRRSRDHLDLSQQFYFGYIDNIEVHPQPISIQESDVLCLFVLSCFITITTMFIGA